MSFLPFLLARSRGLLTLAALLLTFAAQAQTAAWQAVLPAPATPNGLSEVRASVADASGNVYIAGLFTGTASFGPLTLTSPSNLSGFVAKWNSPTNTFVWAQMFSASFSAGIDHLALSGNALYVGGSFNGALMLNGSPLAPTIPLGSFVAKLTDAGSAASLAWLLPVRGQSGGNVAALTVSGNQLYLSGWFTGPMQLGNAQLGSTGAEEGYVAKLLDTGNAPSLMWVQRTGGRLNSVAVDGANVYVTGNYNSAQVSVGSTVLTNASGTGGHVRGFVAKLVDNGASSVFAWVLTPSAGASTENLYGVAATGGSVYVLGNFTGAALSFAGAASLPNTSTLPLASWDGFVLKLRDQGSTATAQWLLPIGGPGNEGANHMTVSGQQLFIAGGFRGASASIGGVVLTTPYQPLPYPLWPACLFAARLTDAGGTFTLDYVLLAQGGRNSVSPSCISMSGSQVFVGGYVTGSIAFGAQQLNVNGLAGFVASFDAAAPLAAAQSRQLPGLAVYPNPAHGSATVRLPAAAGRPVATLTLLDALGRVVRRQPVTLAAEATAELPLHGLPAGLYRLHLLAGQQQASRSLVVE